MDASPDFVRDSGQILDDNVERSQTAVRPLTVFRLIATRSLPYPCRRALEMGE